VMAGLQANRAQTARELLDAFRAYHSPMQNLVVADTAGNTAFKAAGRVPLRKPGNDIRGIAPSPGWDARYDWSAWLPDGQTPAQGNAAIAAAGWLATANQRITPPGYPYFLGQDWTVPYRQDRIDQLLGATATHDMASMQAIQGDVHSEAALKLLPYLQKALSASRHPLGREAEEMMRAFDGQMRPDSAAPLVLVAWADELARGVIGGRLGENRFRTLYGKRHFRAAIEDILQRNDASWCGPQGCDQQSIAALDRALARLQTLYGNDTGSWRWHWGHAHQALSAHRPFANAAPFDRFFNLRVPTGGDTFTVNVGQHWDAGDGRPFANRQGASMRAIYDLGDLEKSLFIYQAGQSGLVFSGRYRDMSEQWAAVKYRPLQLDPPQWRHRLTL
ncbi:MAG: penicillin acylase family protein, partial [Haliea sp.]